MSKERIFSIGISVISILLTIQAFRYPAESSQFPRFLCLLMVLFSVMILVRNIMGKTTAKAECHASFKEVMKVPFIVFASTAMYIFAIQFCQYGNIYVFDDVNVWPETYFADGNRCYSIFRCDIRAFCIFSRIKAP